MMYMRAQWRNVLCLMVILLSIKNGFAQSTSKSYDICVYGGTSAGVIAAYTAAKLGKSVLLIEPGKNLGGMSSGGLGLTDIGNKYAISGLSLDFYRRVGKHYGRFEQWVFEPHVAEKLFNEYVKNGKVPVLFQNRIVGLTKKGNQIVAIQLENPKEKQMTSVKAKVFIDCSYEGDLMANAGVSYAVGREANAEYGETFNGVQLMNGHQMPPGIDPYKIKGDPQSGLLWGIGKGTLAETGSGDKKVQAYNFRICLTNNPDNRIPITQPDDYLPERYELLIRQMEKREWKSLQDVFIWSGMPNQKTDINNRNGFSTDMIGMNWDYPEANYDKRAEIWKAHVDYTKGLLFFVGTDPRVPEHIRKEIAQWGYPKDEYIDNGNWSHQLYVREARRMKGELVMTQHHCQGREKVSDGVGMAAYTMDSHNCDRIVVKGEVRNEGNVEEGGFGPYPISYRAIVPKEKEAANLIVPVCLSATHIAYGSIRMEPVFMVLAQSAATAAVQAIDQKVAVQQINVAKLQQQLKANPLVDGSRPEIVIDNSDQSSVTLTGKWDHQTYGGYGPDFLVASENAGQPQSIKYNFNPSIKGKYEVFTYYPKRAKTATESKIIVFDGKQQKQLHVKDSDVKVLGQTYGEWVSLGTYDFSPKAAFVEIIAGGTATVADAVLLVPRE